MTASLSCEPMFIQCPIQCKVDWQQNEPLRIEAYSIFEAHELYGFPLAAEFPHYVNHTALTEDHEGRSDASTADTDEYHAQQDPGLDDERLLAKLEARLDKEGGADAWNAETFGADSSGWSFEEAVAANGKIRELEGATTEQSEHLKKGRPGIYEAVATPQQQDYSSWKPKFGELLSRPSQRPGSCPITTTFASRTCPHPLNPNAAEFQLPPPPPPPPLETFAIEPVAEEEQFLTAGSANHHLGLCKPCAFAWKPGGCQSGAECKFCHLCLPGEKRWRKKVRKQMCNFNKGQW